MSLSLDAKKDPLALPVVEKEVKEIVSRLVAEDTVPWYQKPNLRMLYIIFIPTCLGVEMTSGYVLFTSYAFWLLTVSSSFDSSMMNGLQAVDSWDACEFRSGGPHTITCLPTTSRLQPASRRHSGRHVSNLFAGCHRCCSIRAVRHRSIWSSLRYLLWKRDHDHRRHSSDRSTEP